MPRKHQSIIAVSVLACAGMAAPVAGQEVSVSVEPVVGDFVERSFLDERRYGIELSGTWSFGDALDLRVAWHDAQTPLTPVVTSPYWRDYSSASGYSLSFRSRSFGPFELYGRVDVLDSYDARADSNLKFAVREPHRVTIAGASARWRPNNDSFWGLEAGANRASDRPTIYGIGLFVTF